MDYTNKYPRVLIVSRNALKKSGSNGRVLGELFRKWDPDCVAQFFTHNELPDHEVCRNYYRVTDMEVIKALLPWNKAGRQVENYSVEASDKVAKTGSSITKNPMTYILQDAVYNLGLWKNKAFKQWLDDFNPEVIFLMAGASSMMHKIAIDISDKRSIPLVVFNTENYYLKDYNYLERQGWKWVFPFYKWECDRMFERLMRRSSHEIYNNKRLDDQYFARFHRHGSIIYLASSLKPFPKSPSKNGNLVFSYAGNLGINRHKSLIEIARALQSISSGYYLDVYGGATDNVARELQATKGIRYHGLVPYAKVLEVIQMSDFMVHAESFDDFWAKDLDVAFSSKLSDLMSSGRCLILYAPENLACSQYVKENNAGCLITSPEKLEACIRGLLSDKLLQQTYVNNALLASNRDMNADVNSKKVYSILIKVCNDNRFV